MLSIAGSTSKQAISVLSSGERYKVIFLTIFLMGIFAFAVVFVVSLIDRRWGLPGRPKPQRRQSTKSIAVQSAMVTVFFLVFGIIWQLVTPPIAEAFSWITSRILQ